jgi:hypothetical protein
MNWRPFRIADLSTCLEIQPACIGDEIVGRETALDVWTALVDSPAFLANVIEAGVDAHGDGGGKRIVGCGIGVFVAAAFVDAELESPRPGLNARIIAGIVAGEPIVLDRDSIASGNAGAGLDFVNLYGTWLDDGLDADALIDVQTLLGTSFVESFAGYRFNRVLKEAIGAPRVELARATGSYRIVAEYPERDSALAVVSPDSARAAPYSVATKLYRYVPPVLRLRPAEQTLLIAALDGKTDAELSKVLDLSLEAVKKRWISIYAKAEDFKPELLSGDDPERAGRGPQKRHRVVAYVRAHPEELRPYAWPA